MPAASVSRARRLNSAMCVLQIGQPTKVRNFRWTRRFGSGRFMASPVTASITVVRSMSPGLNFMAFPLVSDPRTIYRFPPKTRITFPLSGAELVCRGNLAWFNHRGARACLGWLYCGLHRLDLLVHFICAYLDCQVHLM